MRSGLSEATKRVDSWLDRVFFAAWEVSVLAIPTLWFLLFATPRAAVSLSGLTALAASAVGVGALASASVVLAGTERVARLRCDRPADAYCPVSDSLAGEKSMVVPSPSSRAFS
ncbi:MULTISPECIES: hypothetical protein [Haloferax]|uniref:Uncharacterized protein n=1 Tax=Haloferax sp. Atlit-48N TaxID=2077198 RepID=A0ACD5I2K9_9EURY|nr:MULTISPECIES: hypothetical protein [unclassified Haloferax]